MHILPCPVNMSLNYLCVGIVESKAHYLIIPNQSTLGKRNVAVFFHQPHSRVAVMNWRRATMTQFGGPITVETFKITLWGGGTQVNYCHMGPSNDGNIKRTL